MHKKSTFLTFLTIIIFNGSAWAEIVRDPSAPLALGIEKSSNKKPNYVAKKYILSSVFIEKDKKIAFINNKQYQEGDVIGSYRVKKINIREVLISSSNKNRVLELYPIDKTGFSLK